MLDWKKIHGNLKELSKSTNKHEADSARNKAEEIKKKFLTEKRNPLPLDVELEYLCGRYNSGFRRVVITNMEIGHDKKSIDYNK
ncbi:hypothetical protein LCGC14_1052340 [marine sediment metagenome]|uniref:Uncharacterized protein n=1 Tax=marine sediment metagenome TaxID=412755 RepID=A0A0F9MNF2_9ZZZZ